LDNKINKINAKDWEKLGITPVKGIDSRNGSSGGGDNTGYWETNEKPGIYMDESGRYYSVYKNGHAQEIDSSTLYFLPGVSPPPGINLNIRIPLQRPILVPSW